MRPEQLATAIDCRLTRAALWAPHLDAAMVEYGIDTPARQAAFLAQVAHESGRLVYVKELWGPTNAQKRYEFREDMGNTEIGDGFKYRGRGLIQVTGRANYRQCGAALGLPLEDHPEQLEQFKYAAQSAAWFWMSRGLNELADRGDFRAITRKINGGFNGYDDRLALWKSAQGVLA